MGLALKELKTFSGLCSLEINEFNHSRDDPGQSEKTNLNFYFHTSCGESKGFIEDL